ncbi:phage tail assembly chaperone [Hyphobacterium vulgare]
MAREADPRKVRGRIRFFPESAGRLEALCKAVAYHAEWEVALDFEGDGTFETKADYFERFGQEDKIPDAPEIPHDAFEVYGAFWQFGQFRKIGEGGPQPLQPSEVEAWLRLTGRTLSTTDISTIFAMDSEYLDGIYRGMAERRTKSSE